MSVNADAVLKGTSGVYECHSGNNSETVDHMSFSEVVSRGITSMDMMALTFCEENGIPGWFYFTILIDSCNLRPSFPKNVLFCL